MKNLICVIVAMFSMQSAWAQADQVIAKCSVTGKGTLYNFANFYRTASGAFYADVADNYMHTRLTDCKGGTSSALECAGYWKTFDGRLEPGAVRLNAKFTGGFSVDMQRPKYYGGQVVSFDCN